MKRPYSKVDTSKLTKAQKDEHAARLARVRKYTRTMREWKRKIKTGEIPKSMSLRDYRRGTSSKLPHLEQVQLETAATIRDLKGEQVVSHQSMDRILLLKRLLAEIEATDKKQKELFAQVGRLA